MAEGVGFEPTVGFPTSVFKTDAIDHSATPPDAGSRGGFPFRSRASSKSNPAEARDRPASPRMERGGREDFLPYPCL